MNIIRLTRKGSLSEEQQVNLPASKSISNRALIIQFLTQGKVSVQNLSEAMDTQNLQRALEDDNVLDVGEAGTSSRFALALAAVTPGTRVITGSKRLKERPFGPLIKAIRELGGEVNCLENEGFLPVEVRGKELEGGEIEINPGKSSQFVSALMLIAPQLPKGLTIRFTEEPTSFPYLMITASVMKSCGVDTQVSKEKIVIPAHSYREARIEVESDWTSASYFFSAVALNPGLMLSLYGLQQDSVQGDRALVNLYGRLGVKSEFVGNRLLLSHGGEVKPDSEIDFTDFPDLAQTVAVTYAGLGLPLTLTGLHTLRVKETDRILAVKNELEKFGVGVSSSSAQLEIHQRDGDLVSAQIETYQDHRMAMAFSPLAFLTDLEIQNPEVVSKSFPLFFDEFQKLGVLVESVS